MEYQEFYKGLKNHIEYNFVIGVVDFIIRSKVRPSTTNEQWLQIVSFLHLKGWLQYGRDAQGQITTIISGYRIKEFDESKCDDLPEVSEGTILFIPFAASIAKDRVILKRMLSEYVLKNEDIEEVIFYDQAHSPDKPKLQRFILKEKEHGKRATTQSTANADVLSESVTTG